MPNWCYNKLTITGPEADVRSFKEKAAGPCPWLKPDETEVEVLNFHSLVPVPDEVLQAGYEAAGYDWERENWGCKWGADEPQILDEGETVSSTSSAQLGHRRSSSCKKWLSRGRR